MFKFRPIRAVLLSCAVAAVVPIAMAAQDDVVIAPNVFASCQYRFMAIFPTTPSARDITYTIRGMTVPARQFYVEQGENRYSVTIADFTNGGPAIDEEIVERCSHRHPAAGRSQVPVPRGLHAGHPGPSAERPGPQRTPASRFDLHGGPPPCHHGDLCRPERLHDHPVRAVHRHARRQRPRPQQRCHQEPLCLRQQAGFRSDGRRPRQAGGRRARRRRCAAPADRTDGEGQRQILGAGTVARRRRRAASARNSDLRGQLGSRQGHGARRHGTATSNIRRPRSS